MIRRKLIAMILAACAFAGTHIVRADELRLHANRLYVPVTINGLKVEALLESLRGAIDPQPTAGEMNIGTSVLRRFVLVIDYSQRAVWFDARTP